MVLFFIAICLIIVGCVIGLYFITKKIYIFWHILSMLLSIVLGIVIIIVAYNKLKDSDDRGIFSRVLN